MRASTSSDLYWCPQLEQNRIVMTRLHSVHCSFRTVLSSLCFSSTGNSSPWHMVQKRTSLPQNAHVMHQYARV